MSQHAGDQVGRDGWDHVYKEVVWALPAVTMPSGRPHVHRLLGRILPRGPGLRLLEVGSTPGQNLVYFARQFGYEPVGIDYSDVGHEVTIRNMALTGTRAEIIHDDFMTYPFEPGSFDLVYSAGFIEHFQERQAVLRRMDEVLRPGGWLVVTWPNLLGFYGWIARRFYPESYKGHVAFHADEIRDWFAARGYEVAFAGPLEGPMLLHPFGEVRWLRHRPGLERCMRAPFALFNRMSRWLNRICGWAPTSDWWSPENGVFARKPQAGHRGEGQLRKIPL